MAQPPLEWFLNTPVLWLSGLVLIRSLRRSRHGPALVKKLLEFAAVSCFALGTILLLMWNPVLETAKEDKPLGPLWILLLGTASIAWIVSLFRIFVFRSNKTLSQRAGFTSSPAPVPQPVSLNVPAERFADLGGLENAKEQIRQIIVPHLQPDKSRRYGVLRNGILLYGPRGTGKTLLATATAGEFGLNFVHVSAPRLLNPWMGGTGGNISAEFEQAAVRKPALLFIDEIDSVGAGRQNPMGDPGGAGREFNNVTTALMSAIDQYHGTTGVIFMAATNRLDSLDDALLREGRFDLKLRIDLPDEAERARILDARLRKKPCSRFDVREFARRTPGASPAKLAALTDQAASYALEAGRKITSQDVSRALKEGIKDRPQIERVEWDQLVIEETIKQDVQSLIRLLENTHKARDMHLEVPIGVLLIGPPGTGKSLIARLIASQTQRSFYQISAADILGSGVGDSVKRVAALFSRAREHSPAIIFLKKMDSLLPGNSRILSQHDIQVVEQFLTEIGELKPENEVLLIGTTTDPANIDPRLLGGGAFSEKILIPLPRTAQRIQLLKVFLNGIRIESGLSLEGIASDLDSASPADLKAICTAAKRMAFIRIVGDDGLPPLTRQDFDRAARRVLGNCARNTFDSAF